MRPFGKSQMPLLVAVVCIVVTSCAPTDRRATPERLRNGGADGQMSTQVTLPSREQIIDIADAVARQHGWLPEEYRLYDEGNAVWNDCIDARRMPELAGHDYQVVIYQHTRAALGGTLVVIVDRRTGAVLKAVPWG